LMLWEPELRAHLWLVGFREIGRAWRWWRRRVGRVAAGDGVEDSGYIANACREWPDAIERRRKGDESEARDASVATHHRRDAAKSAGLADRAACIRSKGGDGKTRSHGGRRSAARTARDTPGIHRVTHRAVGRILVRAAHGEFVAVRLAQDHCSGGFQALNCRGVI